MPFKFKQQLGFTFSIFFFIQQGWSQPLTVGNWFIYLGNHKLNKNWNLHTEIQYRNYNIAGDLEQLLLRTGIGHTITNTPINLLLGYAYIRSGNYIEPVFLGQKNYTNEHRMFQQIISKQEFQPFYIQHRYRIEERFLENSKFQFRFRYLLGLNIPLNHKTLQANTLYLSVYNEVFLATQNYTLFDRNRLFGALGYTISPNLKVEFGYMTQFLNTKQRSQFQIVFYNQLPFQN